METANQSCQKSSDLVSVNPRAHEKKFIVSKDGKDLEALRKSFKPVPSSVLGQVKDFLPQLASANAELQTRLTTESAHSVDIEHIDDDQPHILMDIGVYEEEDTSDEDDSSLDSTSDTEDILHMVSEVTEDNIKLDRNSRRQKPGGGKPLIQTVGEKGDNEDIVPQEVDTNKQHESQEVDTNQQHESIKLSNASCDTNKERAVLENGPVT